MSSSRNLNGSRHGKKADQSRHNVLETRDRDDTQGA
jgi:hypothetical protein